jgi:CBS-domain-containing membrane protein
MKVEEICTRAVKSCGRETSVADAADLMWEADCGALPVVDDSGRVVGIVTDRDLCMALALTGQRAEDLPVRSLVSSTLRTCRPADEVRDALRTMRLYKVRRLPVVDGAGVLQGMLSLCDLARASRPDATAGPSDIADEDLTLALKAICARKPAASAAPAPRPTATV